MYGVDVTLETLTEQEVEALRCVFTHQERVDWAAYDRARQKIARWPTTGSLRPPGAPPDGPQLVTRDRSTSEPGPTS